MHSYMCDNPYKYYTTSLTGFNITSKIMGIILLMSDVRCKVGVFPSNHLEMKDRDTTANILSQATIHSHTYDNKHKDCRTTLMEMISKSRCVWEEWETTVSLLSTLAVVGGSPTTPALATTAPALVNILMPSAIPMRSNDVLSNNDRDGNNEGEILLQFHLAQQTFRQQIRCWIPIVLHLVRLWDFLLYNYLCGILWCWFLLWGIL